MSNKICIRAICIKLQKYGKLNKRKKINEKYTMFMYKNGQYFQDVSYSKLLI